VRVCVWERERGTERERAGACALACERERERKLRKSERVRKREIFPFHSLRERVGERVSESVSERDVRALILVRGNERRVWIIQVAERQKQRREADRSEQMRDDTVTLIQHTAPGGVD